MTNPARGEAQLPLNDGRELTLVLDFEALITAEAAFGQPLALLLGRAMTGFVGARRALLFAALRALHPEITLEEAGQITLTDGEAVDDALAAAIERAYPSLDSGEGKQGSHPRQRGKSSGRSGAK